MFFGVVSHYTLALNEYCKRNSIRTAQIEHGVRASLKEAFYLEDFVNRQGTKDVSFGISSKLHSLYFFLSVASLKRSILTLKYFKLFILLLKYKRYKALSTIKFKERCPDKYIVFTQYLSKIYSERDGAYNDQIIQAGNYFFDDFFIEKHSSTSNDEKYFLLIDQPIYSPIFNFKLRTIFSSLKVGLPTVPHQYASYLLLSSDKMVLERMNIATSDIGRYNVANSIAGNFHAINSSLNLVVGPIYLELYKKKMDYLVLEIVQLLQLLVVSTAFVYSIWSKEIFQILIRNEELNQVYGLSIIIAMSYSYGPIYSGLMSKLFFSEKTKLLWKISFVAGLGNLLLNLALVSFFGYEIVAITTFLCLLYLGFSGGYIKSINKIQEVNYKPTMWIVIIVFLTVVSYFLVEYGTIIKLVFTFLATLICFYFFFSEKRALINNIVKKNSIKLA